MDTFRIDIAEIKRKQDLHEPILKIPVGSTCTIELYKSPEYFPFYIEVGDTHFRLNSPVFLPNSQEQQRPVNSEDTFSSGISLIERVYYTISLTDVCMLVTGHTDTIGDNDKNTILSEYRAAAVYSLIIGDRELFKTVSNAPHITDKEKKHYTLIHDQLQICNWASAEFGWPCSHQENQFDYLRTFKAFQRNYNNSKYCENPTGQEIDVDGSWGPLTWGAVFDCYEAKLARRLMIKRAELPAYRDKLKLNERFVFKDKHYTGCGEYHPIDTPQADNYNSKTNRHVEILFFKPDDPPEISCRSQQCNGKMCALYNSIQPLRGKKIECRWTNPLVLAGHCDSREMMFISQAHEGEKLMFEPYVISNGDFTKMEPATNIVVTGGKAICSFNECNEYNSKYIPSNSNESGYSYFFVARNENITSVSARLHASTDPGIHS
jgi:hypothetical protein